jgi:transcriptional regulator with XRE-family HTH domain
MTTLNTEAIQAAMDAKGLSPAALAKEMQVSRESVSKWLNGESVPRTDKLLRLSILLKLSRAVLLGRTEQAAMQPQVAFRMARGKPAQSSHVARARHRGKMLEAMVRHLPFDAIHTPPALKNPHDDYDYLQAVARAIRKEMGVGEVGAINIATIASLFRKLQAVIVPVLWGHRKGHENAIHIYLPKTATTWVYLNLDTRMADLKFWLAHELGHTYTFTTLPGDAGEDFADGFAGALLFPDIACKALYEELQPMRAKGRRMDRIKSVADGLEISMVCVAKQLDRYADRHALTRIVNEDKALYQVMEMSKPPLASSVFFEGEDIDLDQLIQVSESVFHSPVYGALKAYIREAKPSVNYVQGILDCSLVDAKQIVAELA